MKVLILRIVQKLSKIGLDLGNNTTCAVSEIDYNFVYKYIFGYTSQTNFELELAVGLPIADFSNKEKRTDYENSLNEINHIVGTVDGKNSS